MKRYKQSFLFLLAAITISGCGSVGRYFHAMTPTPLPTLTPTQTQTPTLMPTFTPTSTPLPVVLDSLGTVCDHMGNEVIAYGRISVSIWLLNGPSYNLDFDEDWNGDYPEAASTSVLITVGEEKNQVKPLDDNYRKSDLRITADDGAIIGNDDNATVLGVVEKDYSSPIDSCLIRVEKIFYGKQITK